MNHLTAFTLWAICGVWSQYEERKILGTKDTRISLTGLQVWHGRLGLKRTGAHSQDSDMYEDICICIYVYITLTKGTRLMRLVRKTWWADGITCTATALHNSVSSYGCHPTDTTRIRPFHLVYFIRPIHIVHPWIWFDIHSRCQSKVTLWFLRFPRLLKFYAPCSLNYFENFNVSTSFPQTKRIIEMRYG